MSPHRRDGLAAHPTPRCRQLTSIGEVRGLEAGADDYIGKPFDHLELMTRVRAVLRRVDLKAPASRAASYRRGGVEIDVEGREVRVGGERVTITATEWRLLQLLVANAGWIVPHDRLAGRVWGRDAYAELGALRVFIRRLRTKLGDDAGHPCYVETVRGVGYRLLTGGANSMSQGHTSAASRKATQQ